MPNARGPATPAPPGRATPSAVLVAALVSASGLACGGAATPARAAAVTEGPESAILRIGSTWEARHGEKGLRSPPSPIGSFDRQLVSRVSLVRGESTATELASFTERFVLRDGGVVQCSGSQSLDVTVAYGRKSGEPAIELSWPALVLQRNCEPANAGIPQLERPAGRARFVLRSDQLVGVEPALEKRTFLPAE